MPVAEQPYHSPSTRQLIAFAIPVMLAALATPLMGLVDSAVLGRLGSPLALAAVAVGGSISPCCTGASVFCVLPLPVWWRRPPVSTARKPWCWQA